MNGNSETDYESFIRDAEELIIRLSNGALEGLERYMDIEYWLTDCKTTVEFQYQFSEIIKASLFFLLVNYRKEQPDVLKFLSVSDLEKYYSLTNPNDITYANATITMNYLLAQMVQNIVFANNNQIEHNDSIIKSFESLWKSLSPEQGLLKEKWMAREVLLNLALGKYEKIIQDFDEKYKFSLEEYENSNRTIIKECYMISRIATKNFNEDLSFGAISLLTLLKFNYYLWIVNNDISAEIDLISLVLICTLYEKVVKGRLPSQRELFSSIQPKAVIDQMVSIGTLRE